MTHSTHIQTSIVPQGRNEEHRDSAQAMQAAFLIGQRQRAARMKMASYDVSNALAALSRIGEKREVVATIGGGTSLAGKIKWLLENEGEMTSPAIAAKLNAKVETIRNVAHKLCLVGVIQRKSRGVFEPIKKGVMV
jgi:hypothetical protein